MSQICGPITIGFVGMIGEHPYSSTWRLKYALAISYDVLRNQHLHILTAEGINSPANRRTGHRRNNPRPRTTQEPTPAKLALNNSGSIDQPLGRPHLLTLCQATGLKERLYDIQRSGETGRKGTGQTTGYTVGEGVIFLRRVHDLGKRLIRDELGGGEGNGHAKGSRVGDVESLETFCAVDGPRTLGEGLVH